MAYLPLSTANLPDPVIDPATGSSPEDYFNTVTYSPSTKPFSITDLQFAPDFVWIKRRNGANDHNLFDSVRGATNKLESNNTDAEATGGLTSFNSDGWTDNGDYGDTGASGESYVGWSWKANGSGVSNTDGDITSTVSANTDAGFSITLYTGDGTNGTRTVGHGLSQSPEFVIVKNRDVVQDWMVWTHDLPATENLRLNTTDAASTPSNRINSASSTTVELNADSGTKVNSLGDAFVMYCFHSVEGFSKFGSYTGNGSTDGPFVYTGFRPAFVMIKNTTYANQWWLLLDSERSTSNVMADTIFPNISNAEQDNDRLDFLSNGFKLRNNYENQNRSGDTFIYMAFAENPFKYSNAR